jgi:hypothetical protein
MPGKSITGINLVEFFHYTVSGDLGYDGSTGNRETRFVTSGYPPLRDMTLSQGYPIYKEEAGLFGQFFHCLHHSQLGCSEDIHGVNRLRRNDAGAHGHGLLVNQVKEGFTFTGVQFFAIPNQLKPGQIGRVGQDNGAGHHRTGESTPPDFVDASDKLIALRFELIFLIEVWKLRQSSPFHRLELRAELRFHRSR